MKKQYALTFFCAMSFTISLMGSNEDLMQRVIKATEESMTRQDYFEAFMGGQFVVNSAGLSQEAQVALARSFVLKHVGAYPLFERMRQKRRAALSAEGARDDGSWLEGGEYVFKKVLWLYLYKQANKGPRNRAVRGRLKALVSWFDPSESNPNHPECLTANEREELKDWLNGLVDENLPEGG